VSVSTSPDEPRALRDEDAFDVLALHAWYFVSYLDERCRRVAGIA